MSFLTGVSVRCQFPVQFAVFHSFLVLVLTPTLSSNFTKKKADELKITGWVRNAPGEKVEGEAQGSDEALKKLMVEVDDGPTHAHVVKSEQKDIDVVEGEKEFVVRR